MKFFITALYTFSLFTFTVVAAEAAKPKTTFAPASAPTFADPVLNDSDYPKIKKAAIEEGKRKVAQSDSFDELTALSDDYRNLRAQIIGGAIYKNKIATGEIEKGVQSPEQLDALINNTAANYKNLAHDAQFLALQLRAIQPFKGIIYRLREYVGKHSALRSFIVTSLRTTANGINIYFPADTTPGNNEWKVLFNYYTEPMAGMGPAITTDEALYSFLTHLYVAADNITKDLVVLVNKRQPIYSDNKVYLSAAQFTSDKDRYIRLGMAEQYTMLASAQMTMSGLSATTAYSLTGLRAAIVGTGKLFGIQTMNPLSTADGMSSRDRFKTLNEQPDLFKKLPDGQARMEYSYAAMKAAARNTTLAWEAIQSTNANGDKNNLVDPSAVMPFSRIINTSLKNVDSLFEDQSVVSAVVNGENVKFNLYAFFHNSPKKLSDMYPQKFDEGAAQLTKTIDGKKISYRNYMSDSATHWNYEAFKPYFPELKAEAGNGAYTTDVPRLARVLTQTWGTSAAGIPFAAILF